MRLRNIWCNVDPQAAIIIKRLSVKNLWVNTKLDSVYNQDYAYCVALIYYL